MLTLMGKLFGLNEQKEKKEVEFSPEQKVVNYILRTKKEFEDAVETREAIETIICSSKDVLGKREDGAYKKILKDMLYELERDWRDLKKYAENCIKELPAVRDSLDKQYHMDALVSPKRTANVSRIKAKDTAIYLEQCAKMISEFHGDETLKKVQKDVIPWLNKFYNEKWM